MWVVLAIALFLGVCAWALWRGGTPERIGALLILTSCGLTLILQLPWQARFWVDLCVMLVMIGVSLWSRRLWTLFAGALMIDSVVSYLLNDIDLFDTWGYISTFGLLLCLAIGTYNHEMAVRPLSPAEAKNANG